MRSTYTEILYHDTIMYEVTEEDLVVLKIKYDLELDNIGPNSEPWIGGRVTANLPLAFIIHYGFQYQKEGYAEIYWRTIESRNAFLRSLLDWIDNE